MKAGVSIIVGEENLAAEIMAQLAAAGNGVASGEMAWRGMAAWRSQPMKAERKCRGKMRPASWRLYVKAQKAGG